MDFNRESHYKKLVCNDEKATRYYFYQQIKRAKESSLRMTNCKSKSRFAFEAMNTGDAEYMWKALQFYVLEYMEQLKHAEMIGYAEAKEEERTGWDAERMVSQLELAIGCVFLFEPPSKY